jgi:hypothetical protein
VEDDLSGRQPQQKTISVEDDLLSLESAKLYIIGKSSLVESKSILENLEMGKTTSIEDNLSGRRPQ